MSEQNNGIDYGKLKAPFPPEKIHWRVGATSKDKNKGMALAYLDARDVMDRLDDVCGPENWQDKYVTEHIRVFCEISLRINGEWISKMDGAGDTDVEKEKGAISDAFKRAAVKWGIGRYLYDLPSTWIEIESYGNSHRIKAGQEKKLKDVLLSTPRVVPPPAKNKQPTVHTNDPVSKPDELAAPIIPKEMELATALHEGYYKAASEDIDPATYYEVEGVKLIEQITNATEKVMARSVYSYWKRAYAETEALKQQLSEDVEQ